MSSNNSDSECSLDSEDSDIFFIPNYNIEEEPQEDDSESPVSPSKSEEEPR